jgi:hypothetical protein
MSGVPGYSRQHERNHLNGRIVYKSRQKSLRRDRKSRSESRANVRSESKWREGNLVELPTDPGADPRDEGLLHIVKDTSRSAISSIERFALACNRLPI